MIFVGQARGGLTAPQRADVMGLARDWVREGTGAIVADVPVDTPNARAAAAAFREIRAVCSRPAACRRSAITLHHYHPDDPRTLPTIRLSYPRIAAVAGPCGLWPEDLGPSINNSGYNENRHYYNFGCATQRNLAAMIDNPSDLVQPRSETPAYTARRTEAFEKYRKGETDHDHLSRSRKGQTQRHRQMISQQSKLRTNNSTSRRRTPTITSRRRRAYRCRPSARPKRPRPRREARPKTAASPRLISRSTWAASRPRSKPITRRRRRTSSCWKPRPTTISSPASTNSRPSAIPAPASS